MKNLLKMLIASFFVWLGLSNQVLAQKESRIIFVDSMKPFTKQSMEGLLLELTSPEGESILFKSEEWNFDLGLETDAIYELNQINTIAGYRPLHNIEIDFNGGDKVIIVETNEIVLACDYYPGSRIDVYDDEDLVGRLETRDGYYYFKGAQVDKEYRFVFVYGDYAKEFYSSLKRDDNGYKKVGFSVEIENDLPVTLNFYMENNDQNQLEKKYFELLFGDELISREKCSISGNTFDLQKGAAYTIVFNNRTANFIAKRSTYDFILDSVNFSVSKPKIKESPRQEITLPKSVKAREGVESNVIAADFITHDHHNTDDNPIVMTGDGLIKVVTGITSALLMGVAIGVLSKKSKRRGEDAKKLP